MPASREALATHPLSGEARDRLLARVAFEATWQRDLDSEALTWDEHFESIFGYRRSEVVPHVSWWRERVHPEDLERVEKAVADAIHSGECMWSNEYRFRRKDGTWAWVCSRGALERDGGGRAVRAIGAMIDISTLKETEARLWLFSEQIPARAAATDRDLRVVWDAGAGFPDSPSTVGKTIPELFADSPDRERVLLACRKALAGEWSRLQIDNGEAAAQMQVGPARDVSGNIIGVMGVTFDITERARAERALREAQRILVAAQRVGRIRAWEEDLRTGMVTLDRMGATSASDAAQFQQITNEEAWKAIHPGDFSRMMELRRRVIDGGGPFETEYRAVQPDGSGRTLLVRGELVRDAAGRPERMIGVSLDVTDRVQTEEEVRANQRLLRQVVDTLPVGVAVMDRAGNVVLVNPASSRIWGGDVIVLGPERWAKSKGWWHDSGRPIGPGEWASERALSRGETSIDELIDIENYGGERRIIENSAAPIRDGQNAIAGAVVVNQDVTEGRHADEELARRARQQAAVAQLSLSALKGDELQPLFDEAAALLATTLQLDRTMVLEALPDRSELVFRATAGSWTPDGTPVTVRTAPGFMNWFSLRAEAPVVVEDLAAETRFVPCEILCGQGVVSGINVPIPGKERPFGVLGAHSTRPRLFTEDEVNFVWSMAHVLATSIDQKRAAGELREKREQLRSLSGKLLEAQEAERRAVARELHDDFGQVLTALRLNLMRKERDDAESISLGDGASARMREP